MKTSIWFLTGMLVCGGAIGAPAATDRELFQKQMGKVAPAIDAKPKALCYCSFDSPPGFQNRVGTIRQVVSSNQVAVTCAGDTFDVSGNDIGNFSCLDFTPLVK